VDGKLLAHAQEKDSLIHWKLEWWPLAGSGVAAVTVDAEQPWMGELKHQRTQACRMEAWRSRRWTEESLDGHVRW
jgi:hypothetical protein